MSWRPFDSGYYAYSGGYYPAGAGYVGNFSGPVTWSCWARFITGVTGSDEHIFGSGYWSFARQGGSNTVYSHVTDGGSHSFQNWGAIGADPGNWYHLCGVWDRPATFEHRIAINGSVNTTGTTLVNPGGLNRHLLSYDSNIEVAHCTCWAYAFTSAEQSNAWRYDPLTLRPEYLRGYWPLARGAGMRQCAARSGPGSGVDDFILYGTSGIQPIVNDDGPPLSLGWGRLEAPLPSVESLVQGAAAFIPSAVLV